MKTVLKTPQSYMNDDDCKFFGRTARESIEKALDSGKAVLLFERNEISQIFKL